MRGAAWLMIACLAAVVAAGGCATSDDVGSGDAGGGGLDLVFGPNDSGGGATDAGDAKSTDTPLPGDTGSPGDGGGPAPDTPGDAGADTGGSGDDGGDTAVDPRDAGPDADPCRDDGVGCPCSSDAVCRGFDDGDLCNGWLTCQEGRCAADVDTVVTCPPADGICRDQRCQPTTGQCHEVILIEDGRPCEDGNPCTGGDTCQAGACVAGPQDLCGGGGCHHIQALTCGVRQAVTTSGPNPVDFPELAPTDVIEQYGCATGSFVGPEKSYSLSVQPDTQVVFRITARTVMGMFLIPWGDDCDVGSCVASTWPSGSLYHKDDTGGEYWVVVDTYPDFGQSTELSIGCYPRRVEHRVQCVVGSTGGDDCDICDDDVDNDWDGLTDCADDECEDDPICIPRVCGDDICHPTAEDVEDCPEDCWECGDGLCTTPYESYGTCPGDCPCGDGTCSGADDETCASCPADCGDCTMPCVEQDIVCGQTVSRSNLSDENDDLSGYTCGCEDGSREERAFRFVSPVTVQVGVQLAFEDPFESPGVCSDDYDLYLLSGCDAAADCLACANTSGCTEGLSFTAEAGVPYVIALEAATGTPWDDWDLRIVCN